MTTLASGESLMPAIWSVEDTGDLTDTYSIDVGDVAVDGADVMALCVRSLPGFTCDHYTKYFERNPLGPPVFVVARDVTGTIVGTAGLHPTELVIEGAVQPAFVAGDFCVTEELRGFGPAIALQRRLLSLLRERGSLAYGLPNAAARSVLVRVGYRNLGAFVRFERRLRRSERLSAGFSARRQANGYALESPDRFDERFAELLARPAARLSPHRTPASLNWRYELDRPGASRFSVSAATRDGLVAACTVSHVAYGARRIVDLAYTDRQSLHTVLRFDLARAARSRLGKVDLLHLGGAGELADALTLLGFATATAPTVVVYTPGGAFADPAEWELFEGAVDV
jgi:hypothetical protein